MKILGGIKNWITKGIGIRDKDVLMNWFGDYWQMSKPVQAGYVSACLNTMGNFFAKAKFRLYEKRNGVLTEIYDHQWLDLWENPNNYQVENELKHYMGEFFGVFGNYYLYKVRGIASGQIREYQLLDPTQTVPIIQNGRLLRYEQHLNGKTETYAVEDVIHLKYLSAYSTQKGIAIIKAIEDIIDIDAFQTAYMREFYDNGGFLGQVFTTTQNLRPAEFDRAKKELRTEYAGKGKSHKLALFTGGLEPIKSAYSLKEMEMSLQRKQTLSEIMTAFRIPQILLGGEGDTYTKATAQAAEANYASTMVEPALTYIDQVLTKNVRRDYNNNKLVIIHDPVSPKDVEENLKYYKDMISVGALTINEVRQMENFDPFPYELANTPLINVGGALVDIGTGEQLGSEPNNTQDTQDTGTEDADEDDAKMFKSEEMDLHWKQFNRKINHDLKWFNRRVDEFFSEQKGRLLERLNLKDALIDTFYDSEDEMLLLMNMLENAYSRFLERGFVFSGTQPMQNFMTEGQKAQLLNYSRSINQTSKDRLNSKLNSGNLKETIEVLYDEFKNRSPIIAETTAVSAFNAGLWFGYRTQGYRYKIWVSQRDDKVRHSHFVADSQKVGIDEMFIVGSQQLMYPGDPTASPEEVINCRCTLIGEK